MANPWHDLRGRFTFGPGGVGQSGIAPGDTLKINKGAWGPGASGKTGKMYRKMARQDQAKTAKAQRRADLKSLRTALAVRGGGTTYGTKPLTKADIARGHTGVYPRRRSR